MTLDEWIEIDRKRKAVWKKSEVLKLPLSFVEELARSIVAVPRNQ